MNRYTIFQPYGVPQSLMLIHSILRHKNHRIIYYNTSAENESIIFASAGHLSVPPIISFFYKNFPLHDEAAVFIMKRLSQRWHVGSFPSFTFSKPMLYYPLSGSASVMTIFMIRHCKDGLPQFCFQRSIENAGDPDRTYKKIHERSSSQRNI